jgi:hypothetical protein
LGDEAVVKDRVDQAILLVDRNQQRLLVAGVVSDDLQIPNQSNSLFGT